MKPRRRPPAAARRLAGLAAALVVLVCLLAATMSRRTGANSAASSDFGLGFEETMAGAGSGVSERLAAAISRAAGRLTSEHRSSTGKLAELQLSSLHAATEADEQAATDATGLGADGSGSGGRGSSPCSKALGVKKVALLFLTSRALHHERTWHLWLWGAVGWLPRQALHGIMGDACSYSAAPWQHVVAACAAEQQRLSELAAAPGPLSLPPQHLFSVYVHAPPNFTGFGPNSLLHDHLIPLHRRVNTKWGDVSLIAAERALLAEALEDPLNERFVLLSETDIPLYSPLTFYQRLMHERQSRVNACPWEHNSTHLWREEMRTKRLTRRHWRKSSQFFGLVRKHAELVVADTEVYTAFLLHCTGWNNETQAHQDICMPDEHYMPTVLSVEGAERETFCTGDSSGISATEWDPDDMQHPRSYAPENVTAELLLRQRYICGSNASLALEDAHSLFVPLEAVLGSTDQTQGCQQLKQLYNERGNSSSIYTRPITVPCPLAARKFPEDTALAVTQVFLDSCEEGVGYTSSSSGGLAPSPPPWFALEARQKRSRLEGPPKEPNGLALLVGHACTPAAHQVVFRRRRRRRRRRQRQQ